MSRRGPETIPSQGAWLRKFRPLFSIVPQDGVGGRLPSPRKLNAASRSTASAMTRAVWTSSGGTTFGSTWRATTRASAAPSERAASTYCFAALAQYGNPGQAAQRRDA